jgi:hypothetical protein
MPKREAGFLDQNAEAVAKVAKECVVDSTVNADTRLAEPGHRAQAWSSRSESIAAKTREDGGLQIGLEVEAVRSCPRRRPRRAMRAPSWALLISALRPDVCRHPISSI